MKGSLFGQGVQRAGEKGERERGTEGEGERERVCVVCMHVCECIRVSYVSMLHSVS